MATFSGEKREESDLLAITFIVKVPVDNTMGVRMWVLSPRNQIPFIRYTRSYDITLFVLTTESVD